MEGIVLVGGIPVAETEMAEDPQAPVRHSGIAQIVHSQQSDLAVSHCPLSAVRSGPSAIAERLRENVILAADAETDADLDALAEAALSVSPAPILAGSAGLAAALARRVLPAPKRTRWPAGNAGPVLAILASSSTATARQVSAAASHPGATIIRLRCGNLTRRDEEISELGEAMAQAKRALQAGGDVVVHAAGPLPRVERPVELVVEHLAHLAFVLIKQVHTSGLLVGGGETAHAVLAAAGAEAVEADDEPLAGMAAGVVVGGELAGRPVVLKPGAAGDREAVVRLLQYLRRRAAAAPSAK